MQNPYERQQCILELVNNPKDFTTLPQFGNCLLNRYLVPDSAKDLSRTSSHNYPDELLGIVEACKPGWVLDCGSGARSNALSNVVTYDIAPFHGVDITGIAEKLPFRAKSFDFVFSLAVLEHVNDPIKAAREIQRVLKPGGMLWIDVAFMQPYHGYPSHFFNMTQQGLESLLNNDMEIVRDSVPDYGTPIWSLTWIVAKYANALPSDEREPFLNLSLRDLLKHPSELVSKPYTQRLPEHARKEMAATVSVLARKKA